MPWGDYRIEFAWGSLPASPDFFGWLLGIDGYSELGETTYLGWNRLVPPSTNWTDETTRILDCSVSRGRDNVLDQINPGQARLILNNYDGRYSPDLVTSPLFGLLQPLTPCRILCEYGAMTTVGSAVINRASHHIGGLTWIEAANPVAHKGRITSVSLWFNANVTGVQVATFFETAPDTFSVRDYEAIGAVIGGSAQSFAVSLDCEVGDYLGVTFDHMGIAFGIETTTPGGAGVWWAAGDQIPCTDVLFAWLAGSEHSIAGDGINVYPICQMMIDEIKPKPHPSEQHCEITLFDALTWLELPKRTQTYTGVGIGALIGQALDAVDWPTEMRLLDTGQLPAVTITYTDVPILSGHILAALESERGIFYIDRVGRSAYEDRHHRYKGAHLVSQGMFNGSMVDFEPVLPSREIRNEIDVTYDAGSLLRSDELSIFYNGPRTYEVNAPLMGAAEAASLAEWLLSRYKDPHSLPMRFMLVNRDAADYVQMLDREISDHITVIEPISGISGDFHIEGIRHEFGGMFHKVTWLLSRIDANQYWLLGITDYSELGQRTYLGY